MADEYIDKVEVGAKIQMMYIRREMDYGGENDFCRGMRKALRVIENMPAADVQPVDRWISVDEALPIYDGLVLIFYNDKTIRLAIYSEDGWYSDEGEPIMEQPDYWSRIPESPKTKKE